MLAVCHSLGLAWAMLPILVQHLPRDRERMGLREVQMAGRLGLTLAEYRALEAGELHITFDLHERIVELCGWPRWRIKDIRRRICRFWIGESG